MELVTVDTITGWIKEQVENKQPINPSLWVEASMKLNVLLGDEQNKLFDIQQQVADLRKLRIESGDTVSKAKVYIEATNEYKDMCKQRAKIERAVEMIRIAKLMSRMSLDEIRSN